MTLLLTMTPQGLYCPAADVHIDPVRRVPRAVITHGHSDHARSGHGIVYATPETLAIMAARYGRKFCQEKVALAYGEERALGEVTLSLHSAGHVLGSAQVLLKNESERAVITGDFKRSPDPSCAPFELVPCDTFVTEATFALPVFRLPPVQGEICRLMKSLALFPERTHLIGVYSLGKAQRMMVELRLAGFKAPIYLHKALWEISEIYRAAGVPLGDLRPLPDDLGVLSGEGANAKVILCPPQHLTGGIGAALDRPVTVMASGWLLVGKRARQAGLELPLVISDHADWDELCETILETGASEILVTHGDAQALVHWCKSRGRKARPLNMIGCGRVAGENDSAAQGED